MIRSSTIRNGFPEVSINIPHVTVIGTDSFDEFMRENNLWNDALSNKSNKQINNIFITSSYDIDIQTAGMKCMRAMQKLARSLALRHTLLRMRPPRQKAKNVVQFDY